MSEGERIFTGHKVLLPGAETSVPATIRVETLTGKITDIRHGHSSQAEHPTIPVLNFVDVGDKVLLPGLVEYDHSDPIRSPLTYTNFWFDFTSAHVHLNEPGRTDWEGFWTGTRAAVSGGVTTVVDMPLNSIPPTTTVNHFEQKRKAARGQCWADVAFWGGVIPGNQVCMPDRLLFRISFWLFPADRSSITDRFEIPYSSRCEGV